ncbi:hypothetical protein [Flavilitoribacter nigricans]|uniref:hypothetical protein n=1 Tax=Flavilitoribacter nigricans TaxID=70997 RepID=UPI00117A6B2A|nr:hypothetical protein [Flavilitoribacter nigricans]
MIPISVKSFLFLVLAGFGLAGCGQSEEAIIPVFEQYQTAVAEADPQKFLNAIDAESKAYLLAQLEYLQVDEREAVETYVNESSYPVVNVDMIARALNHYDKAQVETLSAEDYLDFNLGYLFQLEGEIIEGLSFREQLLQTDQRAKLRFSKPLDDERSTIADFEFLKEGDQWKLNLLDRMILLENNARITLKYAEQNTWDYVAEKLDKYYPG